MQATHSCTAEVPKFISCMWRQVVAVKAGGVAEGRVHATACGLYRNLVECMYATGHGR